MKNRKKKYCGIKSKLIANNTFCSGKTFSVQSNKNVTEESNFANAFAIESFSEIFVLISRHFENQSVSFMDIQGK